MNLKEEKIMLYIVATPIGNLKDITIRALEVLKEVDFIAAEDTRHTLKLLNHYGIKKPLISYYEHNKIKSGEQIINRLKKGETAALVTDAGLPGISDPGEDLVKLAVNNNIKMTVIPGPVALTAGLVLSGKKTAGFVFEGFLPVSKKQRNKRLEKLKDETNTVILYEAPHKLKKTLADLYKTMNDRNISIARELTKIHEEVIHTTLGRAVKMYENKSVKGEYVIVIEGRSEDELAKENYKKWDNIPVPEHVKMYIDKGFDKKEAMKKAALDRGIPKREIYSFIVREEL